MDVIEVMAQIIVTDLDRSTAFYGALLGGPPDVNPMPKLHEWHLDRAGAIQVYEEPERAGRSGATLHVADLDAAAAHLDSAGIAHEPVAEADYVRIVVLADPDGNRIVLAGEK
jgi:predicted enzyme related to lactoylglutathione lyase